MAAIDPLLNLVTVSVPMLLIVIGFAYAVHVISCYYNAIEEGHRGAAAEHGLYAVLLPTFLTSATTVMGFFSLVTHSLAAIRQFGLYGGIGVGIAGIAALTYVPAVLALLREPEPKGSAPPGAAHPHEHGRAFERLLARLGEFDCRNATAIFMRTNEIWLELK